MSISENIIWKEIINYPNYAVSTNGLIKNITTDRVLRHSIRNGYPSISLCINNHKKTINIHSIVAESFLLKPTNGKYVVNHINENKEDNSLVNLEYVTYAQNTKHSQTGKRTYNTTPFDLNDFNVIPEFNRYMISRNGDIYSTTTKRLCSITTIPSGYCKIKLLSNDRQYKDKYIHVLLATTYLDYIPTNESVINHKDAIKSNNIISNLEILTKKQNAQHSVIINNHKIFRKSVYYIENNIRITFLSAKNASIATNIDHSSIIKSCKSLSRLAGNIQWYYT